MARSVIVGSGHVGASVAFLFALRELFDEVVLVDKRPARARAEADDMMAALPRLGSGTMVRGGGYEDCADADLVVLCAAAPARLGQTRNDMFLKNAAIAADVVSQVEGVGFDGLYLVVSNPVDLVSTYLVDTLGVSSSRVVGTGTLLDSLRLEDCLKARYGSEVHVRALALGEHGEGLVVEWDATTVDGVAVPEEDRDVLRRSAIDAAYDIMKGKGSTSYGIAMATSLIVDAWQRRDESPLPLSIAAGDTFGAQGLFISVPAAFGADGVHSVDVGLSRGTEESLRKTCQSLREVYDEAVSSLGDS